VLAELLGEALHSVCPHWVAGGDHGLWSLQLSCLLNVTQHATSKISLK